MGNKEIHIGDGDRIKIERPFPMGMVIVVSVAVVVVGAIAGLSLWLMAGRAPVVATPPTLATPAAVAQLPSTPTPKSIVTPTPTTALIPSPAPALTPAPVPARVAGPIIWSDDFNNGTLDTSRWSTLPKRGYFENTPEVTVRNERLEIAITSQQLTGGGVFTLVPAGDFDARVEYGLINWQNQDVEKLGIIVWPLGGSFVEGTASVNRTYDTIAHGGVSGNAYATNVFRNIVAHQTNDTKGTLRIVRKGLIITGYYLGPSGWIQLGSGSFASEKVELALMVWNDPGRLGTPKVWIDNFSFQIP